MYVKKTAPEGGINLYHQSNKTVGLHCLVGWFPTDAEADLYLYRKKLRDEAKKRAKEINADAGRGGGAREKNAKASELPF